MAESRDGSLKDGTDSGLSSNQGVSEQLIDPWCDLCYDHSGQKVESHGFCPECNCFICTSCIDAHKKVPSLRNHKIVRGEKMPKSQAEKPVKYRKCTKHKGKISDQFCTDHSTMVCKKCIKHDHNCCKITTIHILCESISSTDVQQFRDLVSTLENTAVSLKATLESNRTDIEGQQKEMIAKAETLHDKVIDHTKGLYVGAVSKITETFGKKNDSISDKLTSISEAIQSLEVTRAIISDVDISAAAHVGVNDFIRLQDSVEKTKICKVEIDEISRNLNKAQLSFSPAEEISTLLSSCKQLGEFKESSMPLEPPGPVPDIIFPQFIESDASRAEKRKQRDTQKQHITKTTTLSAKAADDEATCIIDGFDVTGNGEILTVDRENKKIKVLSRGNELLSSLTLNSTPLCVTVINESAAATSTTDQQLHILDISNASSPNIKKSLPLGYWINCMTTYNGNLGIVEKWSKPPCVKIIDLNGHELLTMSAKQKENFLGLMTEGKLFKDPQSIGFKCIDGRATLMVSDWKRNKIIFLDAKDGHVVKTLLEKDKFPYNLTADFEGNVYVTYRERQEISVWTTDLQQCKPILADTELPAVPNHIVYVSTKDELLVSYENSDIIDIFQVS